MSVMGLVTSGLAVNMTEMDSLSASMGGAVFNSNGQLVSWGSNGVKHASKSDIARVLRNESNGSVSETTIQQAAGRIQSGGFQGAVDYYAGKAVENGQQITGWVYSQVTTSVSTHQTTKIEVMNHKDGDVIFSTSRNDDGNWAADISDGSGVLMVMGYSTIPGTAGAAYHSYDIAMDMESGNMYATRAGPRSDVEAGWVAPNGFGPIFARSDVWNSNFRDKPSQTVTLQPYGVTTNSMNNVIQTMNNFRDSVNNPRTTYRFLTRNSNSYSNAIPSLFGLPAPNPPHWVPGGGTPLPTPDSDGEPRP